MAVKTMKDYLSQVTADYTATVLTLDIQKETTGQPVKSQERVSFTDGSDIVLSMGTAFKFLISIHWEWLSAANAAIVFDFCYDSDKADGLARSFKYQYQDENIYVVKFHQLVKRAVNFGGLHSINPILLRVLGYA